MCLIGVGAKLYRTAALQDQRCLPLLYPNRKHPPAAPPFMTGSTHQRPHLSKATCSIFHNPRPHHNRTHPPDVPPFTGPNPFTNSTSQTPPTTGPTYERLLHRRPSPTDSTPRPHTSETTPTRIHPQQIIGSPLQRAHATSPTPQQPHLSKISPTISTTFQTILTKTPPSISQWPHPP